MDDRRLPPDATVLVRTPDEAIELPRGRAISLDHDLGLGEGRLRGLSGYAALTRARGRAAAARIRTPAEMNLHSGNVAVVRRTERAIESTRRPAEDGRVA